MTAPAVARSRTIARPRFARSLGLALLATASPGLAQRGTPSAVGTAASSAAPSAAPSVPMLVRCRDGRDMACFQVTLRRPVGGGSRGGVDTSSAAWQATLGPAALIGPGLIRLGFDSTRTIRLLVAVDVSGSMRGEGIAFTRSALRTFLAALPASGIEVAVVPFESRNVARGFSAATFVQRKGAVAQLDGIPAPTVGNTALYSAIADGLRALDQPGGTVGATVLLVLTDGINDVGHQTDDDGLLGGDEGRNQARQLIEASRHRVWMVGVGAGVNSAELRGLAGDRASASVVAMDPGALLALLEQIRMSLATQYTLVYGIPSTAAARMGRRPAQTVVRGDSIRQGRWRPPLLAHPLFTGTADSALLSSDVRILSANGEGAGGDRWLVGSALLVVLLSAYAVLWKVAGSGAAGAPATPAPVKPVAAKRGTAEPLLRRDATDAPPRSPTDITNDDAA